MPLNEYSIPAMLADRVRQDPDKLAYTFIDYDVDPAGSSESLTWSEVHQRVLAVAEKLSQCGLPGDRAVILAPQSLEYMIGFLGAIEAGFIAVPLSVPWAGHHDERISGALRDSTPAAILTTSAVVDDIRKYAQKQPRQRAPKVIEVDAIDFDSARAGTPAAIRRPTTAYLQYTSGSTRSPAGVEVTHKNVIVNVEQQRYDYFADCGNVAPENLGVVSWLPLYHDMGLFVGVFLGIAGGHPTTLMSPIAFLQKPARWIQQLATNGRTFTAAPNFAYDLAARRTKDEDLAGMDLGDVMVMINGAERVHGATLRRFNERFAPFNLPDTAMRPSYGLAEATVYVTSTLPSRPAQSVRFDLEKLSAGHTERCAEGGSELVSAGPPRATTVRVVDPETCVEKPAGQIGEVWLYGDHVTAGYWRNPEQTARCFRAQVVEPTTGTPAGPWLRTGDLGAMFEGELFIIGRIKDLLIIDGRNHYPDDIEGTVQAITCGRVAAISVPDDASEQLVVIAELKKHSDADADQHNELKRQVTSAVSMGHSVQVSDLVLVEPGSLPLTTSGKVRRAASAERYRRSEFSRLDVAT